MWFSIKKTEIIQVIVKIQREDSTYFVKKSYNEKIELEN